MGIMPKRLKDIRFIDQRALTLILDIALLLQESKEAEDSFLETVFARSAIANAALLLECVANSCLGSLGLPSRLLDDLDRLPTLSKFDYYLFSRSGNHIT